MLYSDPESRRLQAMVYGGTSDPRVIFYSEFQTIDGVTLARRWEIRRWNVESRLPGESLGKVELRRVEFVAPAEDAFVVPEGARRTERP